MKALPKRNQRLRSWYLRWLRHRLTAKRLAKSAPQYTFQLVMVYSSGTPLRNSRHVALVPQWCSGGVNHDQLEGVLGRALCQPLCRKPVAQPPQVPGAEPLVPLGQGLHGRGLGFAAGHVLPAVADRLLRALGYAVHPRRQRDQNHLLRRRRAVFYPDWWILPGGVAGPWRIRHRSRDREVLPPLDNCKSTEVN